MGNLELLQAQWVCSDIISISDFLFLTEFLFSIHFGSILRRSHGCTFCDVDGEPVTGRQGALYYPAHKVGTDRTHESILADMETANRTGMVTNGVKNYIFYRIRQFFNLATGVVVDSFHCLFHGVAKKLTNLFLDTDAGENANITTINRKLAQIVFPSRISRRQRLLTTTNLWKGTEWRNWIIHVAPIVLHDILIPRDHSLVVKLSEAIFLLNQHSISEEEVTRAEELLKEFNQSYNDRFGLMNMVFNIHLSLHVAPGVRKWGNMWAYSGEQYESWNMKLVRFVTAAKDKCSQIIKRYMLRKYLETQLYNEEILPEAREIMREYLDGRRQRTPPDVSTGRSFFGKNKLKESNATEGEKTIIRAAGIDIADNVRLTRYGSADIHGVQYKVNNVYKC